MKKTVLFKALVDILFILHLLGLFSVVFIIPFGIADIEVGSFQHWSIGVLSLISYLVFLRGLYYLRKVAVFILSNNYFTDTSIVNLKKSGNHILLTGILFLLTIVVMWFQNLYNGKLGFGFDSNLIIALFLSAIGLFFILQSNTLLLAKTYKEENELTV